MYTYDQFLFYILISVATDYQLMTNATSYPVNIMDISTTGGTVEIPITIYFDRDFFGSTFLETQAIGVIFLEIRDTTMFSFDTGTSKFYQNHNTAVELTLETDTVYGPTIVLMDVVTFAYSSDLAPGRYSFNLNAFVTGMRSESRIPFTSGYVEYQPGMHIQILAFSNLTGRLS